MKTLVMCLADPSGNPRPNRIIHLLKSQGHKIDVLSHPVSHPKVLPVENFYEISLSINEQNPFITKNRKRFYNFLGVIFSKYIKFNKILDYLILNKYKVYKFIHFLIKKKYDIIIVEDLFLLPLAFKIKNNAKIIFDAREYYTRQIQNNKYFKRFEYPVRNRLCEYYLERCDYLYTVSPGLSKAYYDEFGVKMEVLRSAPKYRKMQVNKVSKGSFRMVHHGVAHIERRLSNMIEVVRHLDDRFILDFYLTGSTAHINFLKKLAEGCDRIRFHDPVPFKQIVPMLNEYDIGFFYVEPSTFNLKHCLPNKFFEYIQARLAVAIGPSPDMAEIVEKYKCGFVSPEFTIESMTETLQTLTSEMVDSAKINSDKASSILCYERESEKLLETIRKLTSVRDNKT